MGFNHTNYRISNCQKRILAVIGTVLLVKSIIESNERQNIETNCLKVTRLMIIDKRIEVENDSIEIYTSLQNRDNII